MTIVKNWPSSWLTCNWNRFFVLRIPLEPTWPSSVCVWTAKLVLRLAINIYLHVFWKSIMPINRANLPWMCRSRSFRKWVKQCYNVSRRAGLLQFRTESRKGLQPKKDVMVRGCSLTTITAGSSQLCSNLSFGNCFGFPQ